MTEATWIITTSAERPIAQIRKDLSKAGFAIDAVLEEIGVITGRGTPAAIAKLRGKPGFADISPATGVDVGPPDSDISW